MRTKAEQETVILYNNEDKTASIYTWDKSLLKKIEAKMANFPEITKIRGGEEWGEYIVPKKFVKLSWPKTFTAEQREKMSARMKSIRKGTE